MTDCPRMGIGSRLLPSLCLVCAVHMIALVTVAISRESSSEVYILNIICWMELKFDMLFIIINASSRSTFSYL